MSFEDKSYAFFNPKCCKVCWFFDKFLLLSGMYAVGYHIVYKGFFV